MSSLETGTRVVDIQGHNLGIVTSIHDCCFRISGWSRAIQHDVVLAVSEYGVELSCSADRLHLFEAATIRKLSSASSFRTLFPGLSSALTTTV